MAKRTVEPRNLELAMWVHDTHVPIVIARHRLARRYVVRVRPDGEIRLTVPRGASIKGGLAFVRRQADWIAREEGRIASKGAQAAERASAGLGATDHDAELMSELVSLQAVTARFAARRAARSTQ